MIFLGDGMLDIFIFISKRYPKIFRSRSAVVFAEPETIVEQQSFLSYAMNALPDNFAMLNRQSLPAVRGHSPTKSIFMKAEVRKRSSSEIK